jgi:hypothetical protein
LSSIFFPLRTNIRSLQKWGENDISNRIKQSFVLYDEIIMETGTYNFQGTDRFVLENVDPWSETNNKENVLERLEKIENTQEEQFITVLNGKTHAEKYKYKIEKKDIFVADFRTADIIAEIESGSYGKELVFLKYAIINRDDAHWKRIKQNSLKDLRDKPFAEQAERIHGKMPTIALLNNLNDSLAISHLFKMPVSIDAIYGEMLEQRTKAQVRRQFTVLDRLSQIGVPDFSNLSLDKLLALRKDKALRSFRNLISALSTKLQSEKDANIEALFTQELLELNKEFAPTKKKVALEGAFGSLSFIPCLLANVFLTIADVGKEVFEYKDYTKNWLSFIQKAKE